MTVTSLLPKLLASAWRYANWRLVLLVVMALASSLAEMLGIAMVLPLFNFVGDGQAGDNALSQFVTRLFTSVGLETTLTTLLLVTVAAFLVKATFLFLASITELWTVTGIQRNLQVKLAKLIENAQFNYHFSERAGTNTNLLSRECERFAATIRNLARGIVSGVTGSVFMATSFVLSFQLTLVLILVCLVLITMLRPFVRWSREYSIASTKSYSLAHSALLELVRNIVYLKATHRTLALQKHIEKQVGMLAVLSRRTGLMSSMLSLMREPVGILLLSAIIYYQVVHMQQPIGEVMVIGMIFYRMVQHVLGIQNNWQRINTSIGGVFAVEAGIARLEKEQEISAGTVKADLSQPIVLDHVTINYGDTPALTDIDFTIQPFETIGIVGPSGAGKSTLFHVITSLLPPSSGTIRLGKTDYHDLDTDSLRSQIGYVGQDIALFHATLAENISFWDCDPDEPECWKKIESAAIRAGCVNLLTRASEQIGEHGMHLSGGERQRVAIARELFKDPPILVFDEATSALDSRSEAAIRESTKAMRGQRTILIIAHRLSTVRDCDRIIVLDKGKIVQEGDFQQLWHRKDCLFRDLCDQQGVVINTPSSLAR